MSEIVDVGGEEARNAVAAFMGQQMGSFKDINSMMIEQSSSLRPIIPDIRGVMGSVPVERSAIQLPTSPAFPMPQPITFQPIATPQVTVTQRPTQPDNQLELNFTYDIAKDIVDRLDRVERLVKQLVSLHEEANKKPNNTLKKT